jgi:uncharacterized membrane protein YqjE
VGDALNLARVRLDLAVTETELFVSEILHEWLLALLGLLLLVLGLAALGVLAVLLAGEAGRLWALAAVALAYLAGALGCLFIIRQRRIRRGPRLAVTRRELAADREALRGEGP